jgi:hypothetical protein
MSQVLRQYKIPVLNREVEKTFKPHEKALILKHQPESFVSKS